MPHSMEMFKSHPGQQSFLDAGRLSELVGHISDCATTCTACADACLSEQNVSMLVRCIRLNLDCADICRTTACLLSRQGVADPGLIHHQLETCVQACRVCAEECARHAERMEHCRICAFTCRDCASACESALGAVQV